METQTQQRIDYKKPFSDADIEALMERNEQRREQAKQQLGPRWVGANPVQRKEGEVQA